MDKLKFLIYFSVFLILSLQSIAQNVDRNQSRIGRDLNREEFITKRNIFLTEKMELTAEETAIFIPLDNELLRKKFEVGRECRRYEREIRNKNEKTDEEFKKLLKCREEVKEVRDQLDKEYLEKFKKIVSAEKILKYQNADKAFMDEFIRDRQ